MKLLTEEVLRKIENGFNNRKYEYTDIFKHKVCGFFGNDEQWNSFCKNNKCHAEKDQYTRLTKCELENGEVWFFFDEKEFEFGCGRRFYKVKINPKMDENIILKCILPMCVSCIEFEWL